MLTSAIPPAEPADVVVAGFTPDELTEMRRGLVQRLTVAQSNLRDKRNQDDMPEWHRTYETCWSAYRKLTAASGGHLNHTLAPTADVEPPCDDEFAYLSRPVAKD